jgi:uncharacterized protein
MLIGPKAMYNTHEIQRAFFASCKSRSVAPLLGDIKESVALYGKLCFRNIEAALTYAYPIAHSLLTAEQWKTFLQDFVEHHECATPIFRKMPKELLIFAEKERYDQKLDIPYLLDLLYFEWMEIEVQNMPDAEIFPFAQEGDLLKDLLYVNPEHILHSFSYPVFVQHPLPETVKKGIYPLLCFRRFEDKRVYFTRISPFYHELVQLLCEERISGKEALLCLAEKFHLKDSAKVLQRGKEFFASLMAQGAIYGFKKEEES